MTGESEMTRVKVCGITRVDDALAAVDLGVDLLGLNFWPRSPRHVSAGTAAEIARAVRARRVGVTLVGVFVREEARRVSEIDRAVGLDLLQFHGDEPAEVLAPHGARAIKVLRWSGRPARGFFDAHAGAWGFLLDRHSPTHPLPGGTGESWDFAEAADLPTAKPVMLAGGIGPRNVRAAIAAARPWGVDVCSRVERAPGVKDVELMAALLREVRDGQAQSA